MFLLALGTGRHYPGGLSQLDHVGSLLKNGCALAVTGRQTRWAGQCYHMMQEPGKEDSRCRHGSDLASKEGLKRYGDVD